MPIIVPVEIVCAIFLGLLLLGQLVERRRTKRNIILNICILIVLLSMIIDAMAYIFMGPETPFAFRYLICIMAYSGGSICFLGFAFYSEEVIAERTKISPWVFRILKIDEVIWFSLIIYEFVSGRILVFENGLEVADNGFPAYIIVIQIVTGLYTPIVALINRKKIGGRAVLLLSFFNITPIVGIISATITGNDYTYVFAAFTLVLIVEFLQRRQLLIQEKEELAKKEQLKEAYEMAQTANRAKTDFLFSMSHDIRTPMNAITGFTGMAIKHIDDRDRVLDYLEKIQKSGGMLLSLINSVLEVSRIESGHAILEEQCGDVYFSFSNFDQTMREMAQTKDINLSFEFGDIRDRYVYVDFGRCMRIFVNVISNAIKYTPAGGIVKVRCEQLGTAKDRIGTYKYTVTDNGIGMSEEFCEHIFDQFTRENTATVSGIQGSGLGMSVVKSFVELMHGEVSVKSKQGEGSEVTIILPLKIQDGEAYIDPVTGQMITLNTTERPTMDFKGKRILLVEDNDLNREIATDILSEEGIVVEEAEDGTKAVDMMKLRGPDYYDFILMDIQMPLMNGYEATKAIRAMYPDKHIPIIALSANAFAEDKAASLEAGMDDHVAKPINTNELLITLERFAK